MTDPSHEVPQELRDLVRVVSACTLCLWAFAAGLLIGGSFCFRDRGPARVKRNLLASAGR